MMYGFLEVSIGRLIHRLSGNLRHQGIFSHLQYQLHPKYSIFVSTALVLVSTQGYVLPIRVIWDQEFSYYPFLP